MVKLQRVARLGVLPIKSCFDAALVGVCGNLKIQSLLSGVVGLMKLIFLKHFNKCSLKTELIEP